MIAPLNRRTFCAVGMGALTAGAAAWSESSAAEAALPIVDTHQHLWDLKQFKLPWLKADSPLARDYLPADYAAATRGLGVVKTIYMEVDVAEGQHDREAEYVIGLCRDKANPMVAAVIGGRPASDGFAKYIRQYKDSPYIKGVRQVLHGDNPAGMCLGKNFVRGVRVLGELGMSFDLCMRAEELADGDKLVGQCPGMRFIVDHCGGLNAHESDAKKIAAWKDAMKALAQREHVVCKVSGIIASAKPGWKPADLEPTIRFTLDTFGPDRVLFGGDWPVCTLGAPYDTWLTTLRNIVRDKSAGDQKKLFHDNAVTFYGLKDKA